MVRSRRELVYFLAGIFSASVVMFAVSTMPNADATDLSCIRTDLHASRYSGTPPNKTFTIEYTIPSCIKNQGYQLQNVWIYNGTVRVSYTNPNAGASLQGILPQGSSSNSFNTF